MRVSLSGLWLAAVLPPILLLTAACEGGIPAAVEVPVKVELDSLTPETIKVKQGDTVTLKLDADDSGLLHIHGYDIAKEVGQESPVDLLFEATATGRFKITLHSLGQLMDEAGEHGELFLSEVLESGDSFTYLVPSTLVGLKILYHSHFNPNVEGSITVANDAPSSEALLVDIRDGAFHPAKIVVKPGTSITWTVGDETLHMIASGYHEEEEEKAIGFLEVRPR